MTPNQKNCCILLYDFLHNNISGGEISKSTIECAMDTIFMYNNIKDKQQKTIEEKEFFNDLLYSNELLLIQLTYNLRKLVDKRRQELIEFIKIFNHYDDSETFRIEAYKKLPFRYSRFKTELVILNKYFNKQFDSYYSLLLELYKLTNYKNENIFTNVYTFLKDEKVSFDSFDKDSKDNTKYAIHPEEIYQTKSELYKLLKSGIYSRREYTKKLGQYAEFIVYENEKRILEQAGRQDLANKVIFVSREIGDGLGYDILSFDSTTGEEKLIEVKGTEHTLLIKDEQKIKNEKNYLDISYNEMKKMDNCNYGNESNKHYCIYVVFFKNHYVESVHQIQNSDGILYDQYGNEFFVETEFKDQLHHEISKYKVKINKLSDNPYNL